MKKALFFVATLFAGGMFAQNDLEINMTSPNSSATFGPNAPMQWDVTVTVKGSQGLTGNDTLVYAPRLNGNLLTVNQNGNPVSLVYTSVGPISGNGGTFSDSRSLGITFDPNQAARVEVCGVVGAVGPNWRGITEDDTTNNVSCDSADYDPNAGSGMSAAEVQAFAKQEVDILDGSFYAQGIYNVKVYNIFESQATLRLVDLTGRKIREYQLTSSNGEINREIPLHELDRGVILAVLEVNGRVINTRKVMIQ